MTPWPRGERVRVAGISSFGFSGTNAHILVQEAPVTLEQAPAVDRPVQLLTVSAKTPGALMTRVADLQQALETDAGQSLAEVAFTANTGRAQFSHRLAVRASSLDEVRSALSHWQRGESRSGVHAGSLPGPDRPGIAFLFTGQGAQYAGMGRRLYDSQPTFRRVVDQCDEILRPHLSQSLLSVLYPTDPASLALDETAVTQPALFAVDYALAELWRSWGVEPAAVMGHSLGEYVAACVAGAMELEDALTLVAARGRLMQALPPTGSMASVFADGDRVAAAIAPYAACVSIAAFNDPSQTVISGDRGAVDEILRHLAEQRIKAKALVVSHAFHSPLMEPMLDDFTAVVGEGADCRAAHSADLQHHRKSSAGRRARQRGLLAASHPGPGAFCAGHRHTASAGDFGIPRGWAESDPARHGRAVPAGSGRRVDSVAPQGPGRLGADHRESRTPLRSRRPSELDRIRSGLRTAEGDVADLSVRARPLLDHGCEAGAKRGVTRCRPASWHASVARSPHSGAAAQGNGVRSVHHP